MEKTVIIFFILVAVPYAVSLFSFLEQGPAVEIRYGKLKLATKNFPLTESDALEASWRLTPRPDGPAEYQTLTMYCFPSDYIVCALYHQGKIAGVQISFPIDKIIKAAFDFVTQGFVKWDVVNGSDSQSFWATQQYFVSPESVSKNDTSSEDIEPENSSEKVLRQGAVWVTGFNGELFKISTKTHEIEQEGYKRQGCQPGKGVHYLYNLTKTSPEPCRADNLLHWFPIVLGDQVVATGLFLLGQVSQKDEDVDWFERPPGLFLRLLVPRAPQCLYELADQGLVSTHIYYVDKPNLIPCPLL